MNIIELMAGTSSASVGDPGSFPPHGSMAPQCRTELSRRRILKISVVRKHVLTSRTGRRLGVFCCFFWEVRSFSHPFLFRAVCFFFCSIRCQSNPCQDQCGEGLGRPGFAEISVLLLVKHVQKRAPFCQSPVFERHGYFERVEDGTGAHVSAKPVPGFQKSDL